GKRGKTMKHLFTRRVVTSAAGMVALAVLLVCVNFIARQVYFRVDMTADKMYSLSEGTRELLKNLPEDVTLKLFYSRALGNQDAYIKAYAERVQDLLREYVNYGRGAITLEVYDPRPDSDEEEWAQKYGVVGNPVNPLEADEVFYFGLVAEAADQHQTIPFLTPQRERFLEYDISRLIYQVLNPRRKTVGIVSSMPVAGTEVPRFMMRMTREEQAKPWVFVEELRKTYDVVTISTNESEIPATVDVLLVIHPKNFPDAILFAIDQYVLRGGKAVFFVDPACVADTEDTGVGFRLPSASNLDKLFEAWKVNVPGRAVIDMDNPTTVAMGGNRAESVPSWITVTGDMLNQDDVTSAQLNLLVIPVASHVKNMDATNNTFTALIRTSKNVMEKEVFAAQGSVRDLREGFVSANEPYALAARITGKFASAFPQGKPGAPGETNGVLKVASQPGTIVIVADVDLLADQYNFQEINIFGFKAYRPFNNNIDFVMNVVDQLAGDPNLIAIRSRAKFERPFKVVKELERRAQERWLAHERELSEELQSLRRQLAELQAKRDDKQRFILTAEQQEKIEQFRQRQVEVAKQLKEVRKNLRRDIDALGLRLKVYNMALVPFGVCLFGIGLALYRYYQVKQS
ncbi:MAG: Gldg family protein, partial [bacterium]|nr:Gldg family protein [bacterium]